MISLGLKCTNGGGVVETLAVETSVRFSVLEVDCKTTKARSEAHTPR